MPVVDVHTHMLSAEWLELLRAHGAPRHTVAEVPGGSEAVHLDGAPFMTLQPAMFDWERRIEAMDVAGVDVAVVSLTCPNVFWGGDEVSARAARVSNDDMQAAAARWPDRIRWLCSLPWQHPELALAELDRSLAAGAVGVMVLANIEGRSLTDPAFEPIWAEIDRRRLPVLVHPTAPPGVASMDMHAYGLVAAVGFTFDTSLAIARMVLDGFLDRFPEVRLIAGHGGGALPYLAGRLDICWENMPAARARSSEPPSASLRRIWFDAVVHRQDVLELCVAVAGPDRVLYGSDYPHNIGDMAGCLARVNALPGDQAEQVRSANAVALFGL